MGDAEIDAMASVAGALAGLDEDARGRVLRWTADRFGITWGRGGVHGPDGGRIGIGTDDEEGAKTDDAEATAFEHFADLYDAATPADKEGKLLVAAYWRQRIGGQTSFQSHELNRDLKDLGHQVDHISERLAACIKKKPALVLQLRKAGNSQQARKTYKLSVEGVKAVEQMIQGER